jgi:hypothetical protein
MLSSHVSLVDALGRGIAEVAVAVDHLLGRTAAYAELQSPTRNEVGRASFLGHVERVLVAHIDHAGPDLDPAGPGTDGRE